MRWASWTNFALGLWLVFAPFELAYAKVQRAAYEDVLLGLVIAAFALWRALGPETDAMITVSWIVAVAGLWVLVAPAVLGYSALTAAAYNDAIVGGAVLILATWQALSAGDTEMPHLAPHR